jgi:hypothetical protein
MLYRVADAFGSAADWARSNPVRAGLVGVVAAAVLAAGALAVAGGGGGGAAVPADDNVPSAGAGRGDCLRLLNDLAAAQRPGDPGDVDAILAEIDGRCPADEAARARADADAYEPGCRELLHGLRRTPDLAVAEELAARISAACEPEQAATAERLLERRGPAGEDRPAPGGAEDPAQE